MDIKNGVGAQNNDRIRSVLINFLEGFTSPAFGAAPKREIELAVFAMLVELNLIKKEDSLYDVMTSLRVTRSKARQLLFDLEVRAKADNKEELDAAVCSAVTETKFSKDGDYFVLEVENPLVQAYLKNEVKKLGHITDTSFNAEIVRLSLAAVTELLVSRMSDEQKTTVQRNLVAAGAPEKPSVKGVVKGALGTLANKVAGEVAKDAAGELVENAPKLLRSIVDGTVDQVQGLWRSLFPNEEDPV